jgi:hypothetical protein
MTLRERPINRQLEAYEEGWKQHHDEAVRCWDFEENLAVGISIFHALVRIDLARRQRVAQGLEEFHAEEDEAMRECFRRWLRLGEKAMTRLRSFEDRFGAVEGATEFRRCHEEAQEIVAEWRPATPKRRAEPVEEPIVAHTDRPRNTADLSRALDHLSHPTEKESVPLGFNPDDYPLS